MSKTGIIYNCILHDNVHFASSWYQVAWSFFLNEICPILLAIYVGLLMTTILVALFLIIKCSLKFISQ